jgi:N-acyl-D-aspartate/D-glutamate deacylase
MLSGGFDLNAALRDPARRAILKRTSEQGIDGGFAWIKAVGYSSMRITTSRDRPALIGKYISELAAEKKQDPFDLVSELITGGRDTIGITLGAIKEADVRELMVQPWNMIASDGGYADNKSRPQGHPRATGTFPRVIGHYVRDVKLLTLEEAVRKITSLPADFVGLRDRGRVEEGLAADLAIFDPATVADKSTWEQPQLMAVGIPHVMVNGVFVLRDGKLTGRTPGRYLRAVH